MLHRLGKLQTSPCPHMHTATVWLRALGSELMPMWLEWSFKAQTLLSDVLSSMSLVLRDGLDMTPFDHVRDRLSDSGQQLDRHAFLTNLMYNLSTYPKRRCFMHMEREAQRNAIKGRSSTIQSCPGLANQPSMSRPQQKGMYGSSAAMLNKHPNTSAETCGRGRVPFKTKRGTWQICKEKRL